MREAYLTGVPEKPEPPAPPTYAEALAAIQRSKDILAQAEVFRAEGARQYKLASDLYKKADNYPCGIMGALGYSLHQLRRHVKTGEEGVVYYMKDGIHEAQINKLTKKRTVGTLSEMYVRVTPQNYLDWEDTGRVIELEKGRRNLWGQYVPKA